MRWLLLLGTLFSSALCVTSHSGGVMGLWLLLSMIGLLTTGLAFAQSRIHASSRSEYLSDYELQQLRSDKTPSDYDRFASKD